MKTGSFVPLDRRFAVLPEGLGNQELVDQLPLLASKTWSWEELLQQRRVVLLAEARSGKTWELRERAGQLRDAGKAAFFIPLDLLASVALQNACAPYEARFAAWLSEAEPGWFFLDARDEIAISGKSLRAALTELKVGLGGASARARVVISSRPHDWLPQSDRDDVKELLSLPPEKTTVVADPAAPAPGGELGALEAVTETESTAGAVSELIYVAMEPLDEGRIQCLAEAWGVPQVQEFLRALEESDALEFAQRPGDLEGLGELWEFRRTLGTYELILSTAIKQSLTDTRKIPGARVQLEPRNFEVGGRRLGATLTLARAVAFRSPQAASDVPGTILASEAFPDWVADNLDAVLRTGLFDPHGYGRIRFHSRAVREYLAARWVQALHERAGLSEADFDELMFAEPYGDQVLLPAMRPVAAWLALKFEYVREEVFRRDPEVLLRYGDPSQLPPSMKERLLEHLLIRVSEFGARAGSLDARALRAFSDSALVPTIQAWWKKVRNARWGDEQTRVDAQAVLLELMRAGRLTACAPLLYEAAVTASPREVLQRLGMLGLKSLGDVGWTDKLIAATIKNPSKWGGGPLQLLIQLFYPTKLTISQTLCVLDALLARGSRTAIELSQALSTITRANIERPRHWELLEGLATRFRMRALPGKPDAQPAILNARDRGGAHLVAALLSVAERALAEHGPGSPTIKDELLLTLAAALDADHERHFGRERMEHESARSQIVASAGRSRLFWLLVQQITEWGRYTPPSPSALYIVNSTDQIVNLELADADWLLQEPASTRKEVAVWALLVLWARANRPEDLLLRIKAFCAGDAALLAHITEAQKTPPPEARAREHQGAQARREALERNRNAEGWRTFAEELAKDVSQLSDPAPESTDLHLRRLWFLRTWMESRRGTNEQEYSIANWEDLRPHFAEPVVQAAKSAFERYWRANSPKLPSELLPNERNTILHATIVGLTGLAIEARANPEWFQKLSELDVRNAVRHALRELNGLPSWLPGLAQAHPEIVYGMLMGEADRELGRSETARSHPDVLQRLRYETEGEWPELASRMMALLEKRRAKWDLALDYALAIVINSKKVEPAGLLKLARRHLKLKSLKEEQRIAYLMVLFAADASEATAYFTKWIRSVPSAGRNGLVVRVMGHLGGEDRATVMRFPEGATVRTLATLLRVVFRYVRLSEDIQHEGVYSPGPRDHAEHARDRLMRRLLDTPGEEAYREIKRLAEVPECRDVQAWLRSQAHERALRDADVPWEAHSVAEFELSRDRQPENGDALMRLTLRRIHEVVDDLLDGDFSQVELLRVKRLRERQYQIWLAGQLQQRARGYYGVTREDEVGDSKRPDVRVHSVQANAKVAIEVKIADDWSGADLRDALVKQLIRQYLRDRHCRQGILVLIARGRPRTWQLGARRFRSVEDLARALRGTINKVSGMKAKGLAAEVVGFTMPVGRSA